MKKSNLRVTVLGEVCPYTGGIAHFNSELCNHLSKIVKLQIIGYSKKIASLIDPVTKRIDHKSENFLKHKAQFIFDPLNPFTARKASKAILEFKPDVLIFHWYAPYFALALHRLIKLLKKESACKIIAICHEILPNDRQFLDRQLTKMVLKHVDGFLVLADKDSDTIKSMISNAKPQKIFHPIYDFLYKKVNNPKQKLNLQGNVLLFFGYIRRYKGLGHLINALPDVIKKVPVKLLIVGEFWEDKEKYLNQIKQLNLEKSIRIVDRYVNNQEIAAYFSAADAIVTPYISGSQSGVINIAYAFNKPVITTKVGGLGEIVHDGRTGYVVRPGNSRELADAIVRFYRERKHKKFENSIRQLKKNYSWDILCRKIVQYVNSTKIQRRL